MVDEFDDVAFEGIATDLEGADQGHPHLVLFADPFLCSGGPGADPASLCNLRLMDGEDLLLQGNGMLEEDEDLLLSAAIALHDQGIPPEDPALGTTDEMDLDGTAKEKKENRRRKQAGVGSAPTRYRPTSRNAARERSRVKSLRLAFLELQNSLPSVPPNTKLSKLDVLVLATTYIAHLMKTLKDEGGHPQTGASEDGAQLTTAADATAPCAEAPNLCGSRVGSADRHHRLHEKGYLHPVRKWPMRSRLYAGVFEENARCSTSSGSSLPALALPDINYSMPLLDANLNVLFSFPN